jgi:hypothetical protein
MLDGGGEPRGVSRHGDARLGEGVMMEAVVCGKA